MPTAAAATYVRTVLFRRRQSSSCWRVKGFVLFGRRSGCTAGLGRLHVPNRLSPLSAPPVPLLPCPRHGSILSAALVGAPRWLQGQPQKATRLHPRRQSPPAGPASLSSGGLVLVSEPPRPSFPLHPRGSAALSPEQPS